MSSRLRQWFPLLLAIVVGCCLRFLLWDHLPRQGMISDEAEYLAAANWLALGRGFSWHQEWLWTRAPLYPLFLALHMRLYGFNLTPIYVTQNFLSLVNVVLIYLLTNQILEAIAHTLPRKIPGIAALLAAISFPLATFAQMALSETLYLSLLLGAFVALGTWTTTRSTRLLLVAGGLFGLATLTRGLMLGFLPLVVAWIWFVCRKTQTSHPVWIRNNAPLLFGLAWILTILPWTFYASKTYGGLVVIDTTGAYNLLLGTRSAYDEASGSTATRNIVLTLLNKHIGPQERQALISTSCLFQHHDSQLLATLQQPISAISQAKRQQLMVAESLCLLKSAPFSFVFKSISELIRFFQINYGGAERMISGFAMGRLPRWYTLMLFLLEDTLFVVVLPLAIIGWVRTMRSHLSILAGLWCGYLLCTAPLLFAINRFRLPLLPFLCIYASLALINVQWFKHHRPTQLVVAFVIIITTTPYAYLQQPPSSWAAYLGPYPSSLASTMIAWNSRPMGLRDQQMIQALGKGDTARVQHLLQAGGLSEQTRSFAQPLLAGLEGKPAEGLAQLPDAKTIAATGDWRASVVRGDLLRRMGNEAEAKAAFTPGYVDDQNPVDWAWNWLAPIPTRRIDLAGNLDLGYIRGFYLGEGDPSAGGTFRWSEPKAQLRFPQQGAAHPQQICLRTDGRGWPADLQPPLVTLLWSTNGDDPAPEPITTVQIERNVQEYCTPMPATPAGSDIVLTLQSQAFVPSAADLLGQQGPQNGQLRLLGVRLDWAELRAIGN